MDLILPRELLAKKNNQESLQKLLEAYVDDIDLLNQDTIFEFIENEFSIEEKINKLHEVYTSLLNNWWYKLIVSLIIFFDVKLFSFGSGWSFFDILITFSLRDSISFKHTSPSGNNSSRISLVPPWFQPITFDPQLIASIVVLPKGSGLMDKLNTTSDIL